MFNSNPEIPRVLEDIPESEQRALLEKAATWIVRRGLTAPAILFLETGKPLNFFGESTLNWAESLRSGDLQGRRVP